jgi:hypothetical protein
MIWFFAEERLLPALRLELLREGIGGLLGCERVAVLPLWQSPCRGLRAPPAAAAAR